VLPYDDVSVYNELIDFLYLDKTKMKKFDTAAKIDAIARRRRQLWRNLSQGHL